MKKILAILLGMMSFCLAFAGCGSGDNGGNGGENTPPTYYTVTFKQDGQEDVKISVESGKGVSADQIPTPKPVDGYVVVWEDVDLSVITKDVTVNAVLTYNGLKITLVYPEQFPTELITVTEINVITGGTYELPKLMADPVKGGYEIKAWKTEDGIAFPFSGTYSLNEGITLIADVESWW